MKRERDALHNLADSLSEDIAATPHAEILAEVADDHGNPRLMASEFDRILARAQHASRARPAASAVQTPVWTKLAAWLESLLPGWGLARPAIALATIVALAFLVPITMRDYDLSGQSDDIELSGQSAQDQKLCEASDQARQLRLDACRRQVTLLSKLQNENNLTADQAKWLATAVAELEKLER